MGIQDSHERIINTDDEHLPGLANLRVVDVARDVALGAGPRESGRDADDDAVLDAAGVLLGEVHLVRRRVLVQVDVRYRVAHFHERPWCAVELPRRCRHHWPRDGLGHAAEGAEGHSVFCLLGAKGGNLENWRWWGKNERK